MHVCLSLPTFPTTNQASALGSHLHSQLQHNALIISMYLVTLFPFLESVVGPCFIPIMSSVCSDLHWWLSTKNCIIFTWTKGIRHPDVKCRGCYQSPIVGIRWHCLDCSTMCNLCTICYMADEHAKNHMFERIYKQDQKGYVWCDLHFAHLWLCSFCLFAVMFTLSLL